MKPVFAFLLIVFFLPTRGNAQYKSFRISAKGDTINIVDKENLRQGPWVIHVDALRGEPGYEEEGYFVDGKKNGTWREYDLMGNFIALENYRNGDKEGKSQYFNPYGGLLREENWRAYNPNQPYDTIAVYGQGNNEVLEYRIVKAATYSVKDGVWKWFDPSTGDILRTEEYDRGHLVKEVLPENRQTVVEDSLQKDDVKPKEVLEFEKKNSRKKEVRLPDGRTRY